jgi:hypothetical protein
VPHAGGPAIGVHVGAWGVEELGMTSPDTRTMTCAKPQEPTLSPEALMVDSQAVRVLVAPYIHIARCRECFSFALGYVGVNPDQEVLAAILTFHDSGHRFDPWINGFGGA